MSERKPNFRLEAMGGISNAGGPPTIYDGIVVYGNQSFEEPTLSMYESGHLGCICDGFCCKHTSARHSMSDEEFSERINSFIEKYEWSNNKTKGLLEHALTASPSHIREMALEYLNDTFDKHIYEAEKREIDMKMIYDVLRKIHTKIAPDVFPRIQRILDNYLRSNI